MDFGRLSKLVIHAQATGHDIVRFVAAGFPALSVRCTACGKSFASPGSLTDHARSAHREP
jgi:hypothetical protein